MSVRRRVSGMGRSIGSNAACCAAILRANSEPMGTHPVRALAQLRPRSWSRGTLVVVLAVFAVHALVQTVAGGVPTTPGRGDAPQQPQTFTLPGQKDKQRAKLEIEWVEGKLDPILARARDRNVPLVVFACLADEPQNEEFRSNLVANAALARGLADALPMFASNGDPPPGAALTKHKELMDEAYNRWVAEETPDGSWPLPEVLIVGPDGIVVERLGSGNTVADSEVIRAVQDLNKKLGGGVDDVTVTKLAALRDVGRAAQMRGDLVAEWHAWREILAVTKAGPFAAEATAALPAAEVTLVKLLQASVVDADESNVGARYAALRDATRRARGTPLEKTAGQLIATLERDKRFKALLPTLRLTEEAEDLLFEAEASLAKGDEAGALKAFKKLAAKKYAETAAAARARAVHAERMQ